MIRFPKYKRDGGGAKERGKFVYCKLSSNHKSIYYGDWNDENKNPESTDQLPNKLPIAEMKEFFTGSACPHIKETTRRNKDQRSMENLAFSLIKGN